MKFDPNQASYLLELPLLATANEEQQFLCVIKLMRLSITDYLQKFAVIQNVIERCYKLFGTPTIRSNSKISLPEFRGGEHDAAVDVFR